MATVQELLDNGVLITPELVEQGIDEELLNKIIEDQGEELFMIDQELINHYSSAKKNTSTSQVKVIWSYVEPSVKRSYDHFVQNLSLRFKAIEKLLKSRQELSSTTSISRIRVKKDREHVAFIAMIIEKRDTNAGNIMLTVEDFSGQIKIVVSQKSEELYNIAKDVQLDEILGFTGQGAEEIVFADGIYWPDIPLTKEFKKSPEEEYMIMIGDPHFGSKVFLQKEFERFLLWINGKSGNDEQKKLAKKVKYVFVTGDLVEGVGIYPSQEKDLAIVDITKQYEECKRFLEQIPQDKHLIIFTGNHDAGRLSEPQEPLMTSYAKAIYELPNAIIVSNPAMINIGATEKFPGFDCLLYHGGSFIYYSDNIPSIRAAGGQKRVDLIMKYLLQRRHLAPTHNAALTIPTTDRDWLLIDQVPDFFISGHIHRVSVANYRNVTTINGGCWTETTEDQVKRGLEPQPARLILINLKTREAKVMNFKKEDKIALRESDAKRKAAQEEAMTQ